MYSQFGTELSPLCLPILMQKRIYCGTCWQYHATCRQKGQDMTGQALIFKSQKMQLQTRTSIKNVDKEHPHEGKWRDRH